MWCRINHGVKRCGGSWACLITLAAVLGAAGPAVCQDQAENNQPSGLGAHISPATTTGWPPGSWAIRETC
jgi:hypothetical protein